MSYVCPVTGLKTSISTESPGTSKYSLWTFLAKGHDVFGPAKMPSPQSFRCIGTSGWLDLVRPGKARPTLTECRWSAPASLGGFAAEQPLGEIHALARVLELELDAIARGARPYAHLAAEGGGQRVLGGAEGVLEVWMDHDRARVAAQPLAVLDLARPALGLADRPGVAAHLARQLQTVRLVLDEQQRAPLAAPHLPPLRPRRRPL